MVLMQGSLDWFPSQYVNEFYAIKGVIAMVSVLLLVYHITETWCCLPSIAQRARYMSLLLFAVLVSGASLEQITSHQPMAWRSLASAVISAHLAVTAVLSIREWRQSGHPRGKHQDPWSPPYQR